MGDDGIRGNDGDDTLAVDPATTLFAAMDGTMLVLRRLCNGQPVRGAERTSCWAESGSWFRLWARSVRGDSLYVVGKRVPTPYVVLSWSKLFKRLVQVQRRKQEPSVRLRAGQDIKRHPSMFEGPVTVTLRKRRDLSL